MYIVGGDGKTVNYSLTMHPSRNEMVEFKIIKSTHMKIDPTSLQLFLAVLEEGTIARAAQREHIAPSAISKRISELERSIGTELFARSNKGVEPTIAAQSLAILARGALNQLNNIAVEMEGYSSGIRGYVRICANISAITQFLPAQLQSFLNQYPNIQIQLQENISINIAKAITDNATDIGLLQSGHYGDNIKLIPYRCDELVVVAKSTHPLASFSKIKISDLVQYDVVGTHPGSAINSLLLKSARELNLPVKLKVQVTSYDALSVMVSAGLGVGIMPKQSAQLFTASQDLVTVPLDEAWSTRQICLGVRDLSSLSPAAKLLMEHLLSA